MSLRYWIDTIRKFEYLREENSFSVPVHNALKFSAMKRNHVSNDKVNQIILSP